MTQSIEQSPAPISPQDSTNDSAPLALSEPSSATEAPARTMGEATGAITEVASGTKTGVAEPRAPITLEQVQAALAPRQAQIQEVLQQQEIMHTTPTPSDLLQLDLLGPALADEQVKQGLSRVMEHAPPDDRDHADIYTLLRSPSLRAQAAALSAALGTEQADELLRSFGLTNNEPTLSTSAFGPKALVDALLRIQEDTGEKHETQGESSQGTE